MGIALRYTFEYHYAHTQREAGVTMETIEKVRENRLRRMAKRQGLHLVKNGRRDPRAIDYGDVVHCPYRRQPGRG